MLAKYITIQEFKKLTVENFAGRLTQANLVSKIPKKKLNNLLTKDYNFFLDKIHFTSKDGSQNTFVINQHLILQTLRKYEGTDYGLSWKSKEKYNSKLKPLYT